MQRGIGKDVNLVVHCLALEGYLSHALPMKGVSSCVSQRPACVCLKLDASLGGLYVLDYPKPVWH